MSNPLDSIVETLRMAEPRPEAVERTVSSLRRPHPPRLVPLAAGIAVLSIVALWPHGGASVAWAQIAAQDLPLRYHETFVMIAKGKVHPFMEQWVDRPADSRRSRTFVTNPGVSLATGSVREFESIETPKGEYFRHDGTALFTRKPRPKSKYDPRLATNVRGRTGIEGLLGGKDIHPIKMDPAVETRVGKVDRYELDRPGDSVDPAHRRNPFTVYVQPGSKLVLGMDGIDPDGNRWQMTIDYPSGFSKEIFAIPPKGVLADDLDAMNAKVEERLRKPIASLRAGGQTASLRLVAQTSAKELWVLWSGARPNGDLVHRVRVLGAKNIRVYGSPLFTAKGFNGHHAPFGGHSVTLDRRVDRVDLQIPVFAPGPTRSRFAGDATVRNVPVLQLPFVDGLDPVMGRKSSVAFVGEIGTARPASRSKRESAPTKPKS